MQKITKNSTNLDINKLYVNIIKNDLYFLQSKTTNFRWLKAKRFKISYPAYYSFQNAIYNRLDFKENSIIYEFDDIKEFVEKGDILFGNIKKKDKKAAKRLTRNDLLQL